MIFTKERDIINNINSNTIINLISNTKSGDSYGIMSITSYVNYSNNIYYVTSSKCTTQLAYNCHLIYDKNSISNIGYAYDTYMHYNTSTKFIYCTVDHIVDLLLCFLSKQKHDSYNVNKKNYLPNIIIFDKMYLNYRDLSFCLYLWKAIYCKNQNKCPKIIIIHSGQLNNHKLLSIEHPDKNDKTLNLDEKYEVIPNEITKGVNNSTILYYPEYTVPTIIFDSESNKYPIYDNNRYIRAAILTNEYYQKKLPGIYVICVPRQQEAEIVINTLNNLFCENIVSLYDGLNMEKIKQIYIKKYIKIIVTTCTFKLSTIFNNISLIIDTMAQNNTNSFLEKNQQLKWLTITDSLNRMKIGTKSTHYIVMCSEKIYELLDEKIDEKSVSFHEVPHCREIYEILKYNLNPLNIFVGTSLESIINMELISLKNMGIILNNYNNYKLTRMGYFCFNFPLNIRNSAIVYIFSQCDKNSLMSSTNNEIHNSNTFILLALLCSLERYGNGLFFWPKKLANEDFMSYSMRYDDVLMEFEKKYGGYSDINTIINIWLDICKNTNPFDFKNLKKFCIDNQLNFKHFRDASILLQKCIFIGNKFRFKINMNLDMQKITNLNVAELGIQIYESLKIAYQGYETTITKNSTNHVTACCANQEYRIDNKSVHTMHIGNYNDKIYYSLVKTQKKTSKGTIQVVNVLHAIPDNDNNDDNNLSIFLSDVDSDQEDNDFYIDSIENT